MTAVREYESVSDLLDAALAPCSLADRYRASITGTAEFTDTQTLDEAIELARRGWDGGTAEIDRLRVQIDELMRGSVATPDIRFTYVGPGIHMGRFMQGRPDCRVKIVDSAITRDAARPRIIHIVANISASGAVSPQTILRRGAALIVAIDTLERRRIRCRVTLSHTTGNRLNTPDVIETRLLVKSESEHVSLDKLAYFLGHASALRRIMFAIREHEDDATRAQFGLGADKGGYGIPAESPNQGDLYLGRILTTTDWSEDLTFAWLRKTLTEQGLIIEVKQ